MIHENDPTAKDKTMNAAFRDSMRIATKWNSLVNRIFGPCEIGISRRHRLPLPRFERFAIKSNAIGLTPFIWLGKQFQRSSGSDAAVPKTEAAQDAAQARSSLPPSGPPR